jgi:hypothetical protein
MEERNAVILEFDCVDSATWKSENISGNALVFTADDIKITKYLSLRLYNERNCYNSSDLPLSFKGPQYTKFLAKPSRFSL